jgi:hypothetical protein
MSMQDARKPPILTIPLIFLLCAVAEAVDAIAYLVCGQVFVANMTASTVLLVSPCCKGSLRKRPWAGGWWRHSLPV